MEKAIEGFQKNLIVCDNKICDCTILNESGDQSADILAYMNKSCPVCGENLLTEHDYLLSLKMMRIINWINKYFSWINWFSRNKSERIYEMHIHKNVNIKEV